VGDDELERRVPGEALDGLSERRELVALLAHRAGDMLGKGAPECRHGADRAASQTPADERLRPDEDVEALAQVRLEHLVGRVRDLHPREVRGRLAQPAENR